MTLLYLKLNDILEIHEDLINIYGGTPGIRDLGQIESALFRPQTGYYQNLTQQAAALWESLSQNHGFIDGNKRVAFAAVYTFLAINHVEMTASSGETWKFISALYQTGGISFEKLERWLKQNTKKALE